MLILYLLLYYSVIIYCFILHIPNNCIKFIKWIFSKEIKFKNKKLIFKCSVFKIYFNHNQIYRLITFYYTIRK